MYREEKKNPNNVLRENCWSVKDICGKQIFFPLAFGASSGNNPQHHYEQTGQNGFSRGEKREGERFSNI